MNQVTYIVPVRSGVTAAESIARTSSIGMTLVVRYDIRDAMATVWTRQYHRK